MAQNHWQRTAQQGEERGRDQGRREFQVLYEKWCSVVALKVFNGGGYGLRGGLSPL